MAGHGAVPSYQWRPGRLWNDSRLSVVTSCAGPVQCINARSRCQFKPRLLFDVSWSMHAGIGGDYQTTWVDASFSHLCFNHVVWCWLQDSLVEKVLSLWAASEWWVVTTETKGVAVLSTPNFGGIYDKYNINISNNSGRWSYLDLDFVYSRYSRSFEVDSCWIIVVHYADPQRNPMEMWRHWPLELVPFGMASQTTLTRQKAWKT